MNNISVLNNIDYTALRNTSYSYDDRNQIESVTKTGDAWSFRHDLNGNLIRKHNSSTGETVEYFYDADNKLTDVIAEAGPGVQLYRARYAYDPMGRRTVFGLQQGEDSEDWRFTFFGYDGDDVIAEYIIDAGYNPKNGEFTPRSDSARISAHYLHGPGVDEPLVWWMRDPDEDGWQDNGMSPYLLFADGLGSITTVAGYEPGTNDQAVVGSFTYDSFGNTARICGDPARSLRFRYTGQPWDDYASTPLKMTGLYDLGARHYDPFLGRLFQEDPKWSVNLYRYTKNNPVSLKDPQGDESIVANEGGGHLALYLVSFAKEGNNTSIDTKLAISFYPVPDGGTIQKIPQLLFGAKGVNYTDIKFDMNFLKNENSDFLIIQGLDEKAIINFWQMESQKNPKWSVSQNCISMVFKALKAGGLKVYSSQVRNKYPALAIKDVLYSIELYNIFAVLLGENPIIVSEINNGSIK